MCCCPKEWDESELIDGECPACGEPTVDGEAYEACGYSPVECKMCGYASCDGSC